MKPLLKAVIYLHYTHFKKQFQLIGVWKKKDFEIEDSQSWNISQILIWNMRKNVNKMSRLTAMFFFNLHDRLTLKSPSTSFARFFAHSLPTAPFFADVWDEISLQRSRNPRAKRGQTVEKKSHCIHVVSFYKNSSAAKTRKAIEWENR